MNLCILSDGIRQIQGYIMIVMEILIKSFRIKNDTLNLLHYNYKRVKSYDLYKNYHLIERLHKNKISNTIRCFIQFFPFSKTIILKIKEISI